MLIVPLLGWSWRRLAGRRGVADAPEAGASAQRVAAEIDGGQLLAEACRRFVGLQAAWDARDLAALRKLTMPDVFEDLRHVLDALDAPPTTTDVVSIRADLLHLEENADAWLASVEFSGLIRESAQEPAVPFRELWMLAAEKDGLPVWRLARQQALS